MSKIELAKDLIRRAIQHRIKFKYVLADSWFTCTDIIRFIKSRHAKCHWLGMIKDCKQYLGLGKCRSTDFAARIADTTNCAISYNILSVVRRFSDYETIGGLFREVTKESVQLSVAQQIWGYLQEHSFSSPVCDSRMNRKS